MLFSQKQNETKQKSRREQTTKQQLVPRVWRGLQKDGECPETCMSGSCLWLVVPPTGRSH